MENEEFSKAHLNEYSYMIKMWNAKPRHHRTAAAAQCGKEGHDWWRAPLGYKDEPVMMCRRCMKYSTADRKKEILLAVDPGYPNSVVPVIRHGDTFTPVDIVDRKPKDPLSTRRYLKQTPERK